MVGTLGVLLPTPRMLLVSPARRNFQWHIPHTLLSVRQAATSSIPTIRPSSSPRFFPNLPIPSTTTTITIYTIPTTGFPYPLPSTTFQNEPMDVCSYYYVLCSWRRDTCVCEHREDELRTISTLSFCSLSYWSLSPLALPLHSLLVLCIGL